MLESQPKRNDGSRGELSPLLIQLLKGVLYRDSEQKLWQTLLRQRSQVGDFVGLLGLELLVDEIEGYAFLRSRVAIAGDSDDETPRLVPRHQLRFYDSLLLALLRKKLMEFDATGTESRLILRQEEVVDMVHIFLPEKSDEVKQQKLLDASIQRLLDMGFLHRLKSSAANEPPALEVLRIIKAFIDAQWLKGLEEGLEAYRAHAVGQQNN